MYIYIYIYTMHRYIGLFVHLSGMSAVQACLTYGFYYHFDSLCFKKSQNTSLWCG